MGTAFFIWSGICIACYIVRTAFNVLNYKNHPLAGNRAVVNVIYVVMGALWFSWFQMCFTDPMRMNLPGWIRYTGLVLFVAGIALFLISHLKMKGVEDRGMLVTGGIYGKIRNPMYLGFIIWIIGFPTFTRSLITLASAAVWSAFILYWKVLEEKALESKYEGYAEYKRRTWF